MDNHDPPVSPSLEIDVPILVGVSKESAIWKKKIKSELQHGNSILPSCSSFVALLCVYVSEKKKRGEATEETAPLMHEKTLSASRHDECRLFQRCFLTLYTCLDVMSRQTLVAAAVIARAEMMTWVDWKHPFPMQVFGSGESSSM